ncbi:MAG TPA: hypothetical protein VNI83_10220, partial [Vicinamibacterales bacterium]|nr:hypothetical protein [Vicinamibacterales bacterium]
MARKILTAAALSLVVGAFAPAAAFGQAAVTSADIERLTSRVFDVGTDIAAVRSKDPERAAEFQAELDALREEVIYLKVKLRKEGSLARSEYADVGDRLDALAGRVRGAMAGAPAAAAGSASGGTSA